MSAVGRDPEVAYQRIYATVDSIPRGHVASYGQVAREAGLSGRARQVGYALRNLRAGTKLPWHRVVNASGRISPRPSSGHEEQRRLLEREGVELDASGKIDLERFGWKPGLDP